MVIYLQRTRLLIFLLGLLLLVGQFGSIAHATEHPFHAHGDYCLSLSSLEHSSGCLLSHPPRQPATVLFCTEASGLSAQRLHSSSTHRYQARAPPALA